MNQKNGFVNGQLDSCFRKNDKEMSRFWQVESDGLGLDQIGRYMVDI